MKRNLLTKMIAIVALILTGALTANAAETYDFQELCMKIGRGGPWAANDGGDAGFTLGTEEAPIVMHYLGDYTDEGFTWNQRFAFEYVEATTANDKLCFRNKNNKKDGNCGLFSWDKTHYFSILDLKEGDKVTITVLNGSTILVSDNVEGMEAGAEFGKVTTVYTITSGERLDIQMAKATLISKIVIEPYGVETIPDISITPRIIRLIPGATAKLVANVSPASFTTTWRSGDTNVVTVDDSGNIAAVGAGATYVYCEWKSEVSTAFVSGMCEVRVADFDLTQYSAVTTYDFTTMGDVMLTLQQDAAGAIWNEANSKTNNVFWCTNEGLENIAVQAAVSGNKGWSIVDGQGLFLASGAGRCAAIGGIKAGQVVEFIYTGDAFYTKSDGSDAGIKKTALNEAVGRAIYKADGNGMIGFELVKGNAVQKIVVYDQPFQEVDCTDKVSTTAWMSEQGAVYDYENDVAQKEQYNGSTTANCEGEVLYQVVEGLDNGTYTVELYANASYTFGRGFATDALNGEVGRVVVYAGDVDKTIPVIYQTAVEQNNIVTLEDVAVTDGTLRMGLRKIAPGSNWHTIQIKSLVQTSSFDRSDVAAQNAYWKGIAETVVAYQAYANVGGSEKAAIVAAKTKAAAQAAIPPFYAAKAGYDALAEVITKGKAAGFDISEAEALMTGTEGTAEQAAAKAEELKHPVNLAYNTKMVEGASEENPIETDFVVNGTFDTAGVIAPWKSTTGAQNQTTANNQSGAFGVDNSFFYENWHGSKFTGKMYQEIEDIPNGNYTLKICAFTNSFDASAQHVYANGDQTPLTTGTPTAYEVKTVVTNNKIEIGLEQTAAVSNWLGLDNVSLVYRGATSIEELVAAYEEALAEAQKVEGQMNKDVKDALDAAIGTEVDKTDATALGQATAALQEATSAAKASVAAYASAKEALDAMKRVMDGTNVYTNEAYQTYNALYTSNNESYEAGVLTTEQALALVNPEKAISWNSRGQAKYGDAPQFLLSAWEYGFGDFSNYYINTWSTEGEKDGSGFIVPFFEYWTGDNNSLGEKTLTATMNSLEKGVYNVTALVRVRIKNNVEAPANGITMQVNEGEAVDVCTGQQFGQMYVQEFKAVGDVAEDGVLNIKFIVAADNNISWLSFKNVVYEFDAEATAISTIAADNAAANGIYNLAGQRVMNVQKGLYIINGKKVVK